MNLDCVAACEGCVLLVAGVVFTALILLVCCGKLVNESPWKEMLTGSDKLW